MDTKKLTILLVDDDKFLIDMYSLKFSKNGFDVSHAFDGDEALKKIREGLAPDILVVDVIMPGMDGLDLLECIRNEKLLQNSVIIMLTNQGLSQDMDRAKKLNVDGYIIKAMTIPSEVLSEVQKIYSRVKSIK